MSAGDHESPDDLSVFANGVFPVEHSNGKKLSESHRVALKASATPAPGRSRSSSILLSSPNSVRGPSLGPAAAG